MVVGDEGGFVLDLKLNEYVFELIMYVIYDVGFVVGVDIVLGLDVVSLEFYCNGVYVFVFESCIYDVM